MNWLKLKVKQYFWSTVAAVLLLVAVVYYMYRLVKPQEKNQPVVDEILTQVKIHAKESKLRG
jgi:Ca2+/Na+ antiporter